MKKIFIMILVLMLGCSILCGCAELVSTEYETVDVEIIDEYYRGPYTSFVFSGKVLIPISRPATYRIDVEYDGVKYSIYDSDTYNIYKDRVGDTVKATLKIRTYDDGNVTRDITALGVTNGNS